MAGNHFDQSMSTEAGPSLHQLVTTPGIRAGQGSYNKTKLSQRNIDSVAHLNPEKKQWTIRTRVTSKPPMRSYSNNKGEGKIMSVDLKDETGEIRAVAFNHAADKFYHRFEVGKIYFISNARVQKAKKQYSSLSNDYEIVFESCTEVNECMDGSDDPPTMDDATSQLDQSQIESRVGPKQRRKRSPDQSASVSPKRREPSTDQSRVQIKFAIMTANEDEWNSAQYFLGDRSKHLAGKISKLVKGKKYSRSFVLGKEVKVVDGNFKGYKLIRVRVNDRRSVYGVLLKCTHMGSFTEAGSHYTTLKLLHIARNEQWPLKVIFIVGCCGARFINDRDNRPVNNIDNSSTQTSPSNRQICVAPVREGTVFVAQRIMQYAIGKFEKEGEIKYRVLPHDMSPDWVGPIHQNKDIANQKGPIDHVREAFFYSGDFVIKDTDVAKNLSEQLRNQEVVGFEMEGIGVKKAIGDGKLMKDFPKPEIVLVKGVSDQAGSDKKDPKDTLFFSQTIKDVPEAARQQMCTIMSLTLILRPIIAGHLDFA